MQFQITSVLAASEECIGWLYKNSSCYLVSSIHTQRMRSSILNWTDADDVCQTYGGNLASIREQHQFDFLVEKLALHGVSDSLFWLGGRNEPLGEFHWINGALIKSKCVLTNKRHNMLFCVFVL